MDVYTRRIRGWHLGRNLDTELTLTALQHALQTHGPEMHHSDQGVQYASTAYTLLLQQVGTQISMAAVGEPTQNGYAERLIRTIREEAIDLSEYRDYHDAYEQLGRFLDDVYMHKRIHSALVPDLIGDDTGRVREPMAGSASTRECSLETPKMCPVLGAQYSVCD